MAEILAGQLTMHNPETLSVSARVQLANWLQEQAMDLVSGKGTYTQPYESRFLIVKE